MRCYHARFRPALGNDECFAKVDGRAARNHIPAHAQTAALALRQDQKQTYGLRQDLRRPRAGRWRQKDYCKPQSVNGEWECTWG
jgi:hypothetical protein